MEEKEEQYIEKYLREILVELASDIGGTVVEDNSLKIYFSNKNAPLNLDVILKYLERCKKEIK